jgi:hypothetical protein
VAEKSVVPACEDGRHEPALGLDRRVSDGVDAEVHPVEPPRRHAMLDRPGRDTQLDELPNSKHTVLTSGERRELPVVWAL